MQKLFNIPIKSAWAVDLQPLKAESLASKGFQASYPRNEH